MGFYKGALAYSLEVKATKSQFVAQDSKDNGASYSKDMTLLHLEITGDTIGQRGEHFGIEVANCIMKRLGPDLKSLATMFKNTTYAQGFYAGAHHQPKQL